MSAILALDILLKDYRKKNLQSF